MAARVGKKRIDFVLRNLLLLFGSDNSYHSRLLLRTRPGIRVVET
jgi:hypothetical protein